MDNKILIAFALILFLSLNVFATAPVITAVTVSPIAITDYNYSNWSSPAFMTLRAAVSNADDMNLDGCGYAINGSWSYPTATDFNTDTNTYTILVQAIATDDVNWGISCKNNDGEEGFFFRTIYLDEAPPMSGASFNGINTITLVTSDYSTTTGNGSGIKSLLYSLDNAAWVDLGAVTQADITVTSVGSHSIRFCAIDNLDNNECADQIWVKSFAVRGLQNSACGLINLITLLFAALIVLTIMILGMTGNLDEKVIIGLVIMAVIGVICIVILSAFIVPFCGLP